MHMSPAPLILLKDNSSLLSILCICIDGPKVAFQLVTFVPTEFFNPHLINKVFPKQKTTPKRVVLISREYYEPQINAWISVRKNPKLSDN